MLIFEDTIFLSDILFKYSMYIVVFLASFLLLRYSFLKFSTKHSFIISLFIMLLQITVSQINSSLNKYISIRNEEQCKTVCSLTKENFDNAGIDNYQQLQTDFVKMTDDAIDNRQKERIPETVVPIKQLVDGYKKPGDKSMRNVQLNNDYVSIQLEKEIEDNDSVYSDGNTMYVPNDYVYAADDYGFSYIPPTLWYNKPIRAPLCVVDKNNKSIVNPVLSSGLPLNLKEFDNSLRVSGPLDINTQYISEKLNYKK